jgi:hypothetical protein
MLVLPNLPSGLGHGFPEVVVLTSQGLDRQPEFFVNL